MKIFAKVQGMFFIGILFFSPLTYAQMSKSVDSLTYNVSGESDKSALSQQSGYKNSSKHEQARKEQAGYAPAWGLLGFGVFFFSLYFVMKREEFELVS